MNEINEIYETKFTVKDSKGSILVTRNNLFTVERASLHSNSTEPPCEDSFEITLNWNDRLNNQYYKKCWVIEINNILEFIDKHGSCIIDKGYYGFYSIMIYDDYVE